MTMIRTVTPDEATAMLRPMAACAFAGVSSQVVGAECAAIEAGKVPRVEVEYGQVVRGVVALFAVGVLNRPVMIDLCGVSHA